MNKSNIFIDGVIFQLQRGRPAGISRVWLSLLNELLKYPVHERIILLDRAGTFPILPGFKKIIINEYNQYSFEADSLYLQHIVDQNGGGLLVSTYYTFPETSPVALILHDMTPEAMSLDLNHPEWRAKQKALKKSSFFFSVSEATKNDFYKYYPEYSDKDVIVIPNAVSEQFGFAPAWERKLFRKTFSIKKPFFIYTGHRLGYKNAISFLKAFNQLENKTDFELFFTGGSPEMEKVFLDYLDDIKYQIKFLNDKELSIAYNEATALIYPSLYEGFGLPVLEAMKAGCPVIAGNNSSLPEVAGNSALLIDTKNVSELKNALIKIQDHNLRNELIKKGYENVKRFSWINTGKVFSENLEHFSMNSHKLKINKPEKIDSWEKYLLTFYSKPYLIELLKTYKESIKIFNEQSLSFDFNRLIETEKRIVKYITNEEFEELLAACKNSTKDLILNYWCGIIYESRNNLDEALNHYLKISDTNHPNFRVLCLAANLAFKLEKKILAENLYEHLLSYNSRYTEARIRLNELKAARNAIKEGMQKRKIELLPFKDNQENEELIKSIFISVILPTRDRNEGLEEVLDSLPGAMYKLKYEVILVTSRKSINGLNPLIKKYNIQKIFYDEDIFKNGEKFNWSKLMNYGFINAGGNWLVYASDDIQFFPFAFWNAFLSLDKNEKTGGITFLHKNTVETYGGIFDNYGYDTVSDFNYINFGLVNREAFNITKGFDENFSFYWADADLCMRIWEAGFKIIASPYSIVDHNNIADKLKKENSGDRYFSDTSYFYHKWKKRELIKKNEILLKKRFYLHEKNLQEVFRKIHYQIKNFKQVSIGNELAQKIEYNISGFIPLNDSAIKQSIVVSAIVSTYNSSRFLKGCLDDLINQTLFKKGKLEIIVINSGSKENEEEIVLEYKSKYKNIKYIRTEREPIYKAWNRGIKVAEGIYITNANTDDRHKADAFEIMADVLTEDENIGLVYADQYVTYKENQTFEAYENDGFFEWPEFDRMQLIHCAICGPQPMWRKNLHERFGYFDESLIVAGDYEWWLRISDKVTFKHIQQKLGLYLLSDDSIEHRCSNEMTNETLKIRSKYAETEKIKSLDYKKYKSTFLKLNQLPEILFSVIITTYNRPHELKEAVKSVLNQSIRNFELIVVNDGGIDISNELKIFNDKRIKVITRYKNEGPAAARNTGILNSTGKYIAFLDDDDIYYNNHLETALKYLRKGCKVVYTDASRFTYKKIRNDYKLIDKSIPYSIDYSRNKLLLANISPVNCFAFEKDLLNKAGLFNEKFKVLEDWEFWIRISNVTDFHHIKKTTVQVNWKDDGSTITSSKIAEFQRFRQEIYNIYSSEIENIKNKDEILFEFQSIWSNDFIKKPVVSVIVPTFNQLNYTKEFITSLQKFTSIPFELIVIINNKKDGTIEYLNSLAEKNKFQKIIVNEENKGFPASINQGIKAAKAPFILISNNDVVVTKGLLESLIDISINHSAGIVGPVSNSVSGVQLDKNAKYSSIEEMHLYADKVAKENKGKIFNFPRVTFLCTLIKREVIEKIGGLDERFSPGNFEDDDFCLRAQLAGFKTVVARDVFIHHYGSKSFKADGEDKYAERLKINRQKFVDKWGADPDEIWIKGKSIKNNEIFFPLFEKDKVTVKFNEAARLIEEKNYEESLKILEELLSAADIESFKSNNLNYEDLLNLAGKVAFLKGDLESAQKFFEDELKLNPQSSRACTSLGELFYSAGIFEAAKTMFEWGVKNDPSNTFADAGLQKANQKLNLPANDFTLQEESVE